MIPLSEQLHAFLLTTVAGVGLGVMYDALRLLRHYLKSKIWFTQVGDLVYWLLVTPLVFLVLLKGTWGEVRIWVFLSLALGTSLYIYFLSNYVLKLMISLTNFIIKVLKFLFNLVLWPFKVLIQIILIPLGFIAKLGSGVIQFFKSWWFRLVMKPLTGFYRSSKHKGNKAVNKLRRKASLWISPKRPKRK